MNTAMEARVYTATPDDFVEFRLVKLAATATDTTAYGQSLGGLSDCPLSCRCCAGRLPPTVHAGRASAQPAKRKTQQRGGRGAVRRQKKTATWRFMVRHGHGNG